MASSTSQRTLTGLGAPAREADVLRSALAFLRDRFPESWQMAVDEQVPISTGRRVDAVVRLTAPRGQRLVMVVESKRLINTRDVTAILGQLEEAATAFSDAGEVISLLTARYLPPTTRERIAAAGASYVDAAGNMLIRASEPPVFISVLATDRDPWRGPGRPRGSLRGAPAARVVRALIDFAPPYTAPAVAKLAAASTGATYRVIEFLEQEGLLSRANQGPITEVRWRELLMRWSEDYGFAESNSVETYLEPRGLEVFTSRLAGLKDVDYVLTGSLAAASFAPYAPARLAMLYADDRDQTVERLGLRKVEVGGNVAVATPNDSFVLDRANMIDGLNTAAPSQIAVDLLSGPGRNPEEATALLDWMEANESAWRR